MTFTITRSHTTGPAPTVQYATSDGTATAGSDYTATSDEATFAGASATTEITVPVTGDTASEPDETFTVTLSAPTDATLGDATAQGTIDNDDEPPPTISIADSSLTEGELRPGRDALHDHAVQHGGQQHDDRQLGHGRRHGHRRQRLWPAGLSCGERRAFRATSAVLPTSGKSHHRNRVLSQSILSRWGQGEGNAFSDYAAGPRGPAADDSKGREVVPMTNDPRYSPAIALIRIGLLLRCIPVSIGPTHSSNTTGGTPPAAAAAAL